MPGLRHTDDTRAARSQIRRELAQDRIGVLMRLVHEGGEIVAGIEQLVRPYQETDRGEIAIHRMISHREVPGTAR